MIVADASAVVDALVGSSARAARIRSLLASQPVSAPHLLDLEVASALRNLERRSRVPSAGEALAGYAALPVQRYRHRPLLARIWSLRHRMSPYDAAYVALAEALDAPLVTLDGGLARAGGHHARIEVVD